MSLTIRRKRSFRWRPTASIYFGQPLPVIPLVLSSLFFFQPDLPVVPFLHYFYLRFPGSVSIVYSLCSSSLSFQPSLFFRMSTSTLVPLFSRHPTARLNSTQSACIMNVCHIRQLISVGHCRIKTFARRDAAPARLRYRFPMLAQRSYVLSQLMDSSSPVHR